ncbi:hypothetical protein ABD91_20310 [Lysinibacillus sphaericus]|uniref:hypothetical protein n=1 Tax=Lysinibacillus sphaericus TaxID=1421 RepID=UPI0018CE2596|nr:hypothetical protein [Lysinibacillus sphaericus]MBG9693093.1 hypothetical protein [Lysinibacillus sphaericus]
MNITINGFDIKDLASMIAEQNVDWVTTDLTEREGMEEKDTLIFTFEDTYRDNVIRLISLYVMTSVMDEILTDEHGELLKNRFSESSNIKIVNQLLQSRAESPSSNLFAFAYRTTNSYFENNELMDFEAFTFFNMQKHFNEYKMVADEVMVQATIIAEDIEAVKEIVEKIRGDIDLRGETKDLDVLVLEVVDRSKTIENVEIVLKLRKMDGSEEVIVDTQFIKKVFAYSLPLQMVDLANNKPSLQRFFSQVAHIPSLIVTFGVKNIHMDSYLFGLPFFQSYLALIIEELGHFQFDNNITISL